MLQGDLKKLTLTFSDLNLKCASSLIDKTVIFGGDFSHQICNFLYRFFRDTRYNDEIIDIRLSIMSYYYICCEKSPSKITFLAFGEDADSKTESEKVSVNLFGSPCNKSLGYAKQNIHLPLEQYFHGV